MTRATLRRGGCVVSPLFALALAGGALFTVIVALVRALGAAS